MDEGTEREAEDYVWKVCDLRDFHRHGRLIEGGVDVVNGNRIVGVGGIARNVADD